MEYLREFLTVDSFGFTLTLLLFLGAKALIGNRKNMIFLVFNPLIISIVAIIALLTILDIPFETYEKGANYLKFFLGPITVSLALPLYRQLGKLKENAIPLLIGVIVGAITGIVSVIVLGKVFHISHDMVLSLVPKATTTAIGVEISQKIGGAPSITIGCIIVAGVTGSIVAEPIFKALRIKSPSAKGLALGTASHVYGTNKALSMGEEEGAMSSLAIGLAGIITAILVPIVLPLLGISL